MKRKHNDGMGIGINTHNTSNVKDNTNGINTNSGEKQTISTRGLLAAPFIVVDETSHTTFEFVSKSNFIEQFNKLPIDNIIIDKQ